jgi:hypothetical protein
MFKLQYNTNKTAPSKFTIQHHTCLQNSTVNNYNKATYVVHSNKTAPDLLAILYSILHTYRTAP